MSVAVVLLMPIAEAGRFLQDQPLFLLHSGIMGMLRFGFLLTVSALFIPRFLTADDSPCRVLDFKRHLLGRPGAREWTIFDGQAPDGPSLEIKFNAQRNARECSLFIRQQDVKLNWPVKINDRVIGKLGLMEGDEVSMLTVPPNVLRDGENTLFILSPHAPDDIVISEIKLDTRPPEEALGDADLQVQVTGPEGKTIPCRLTITDAQGFLTPVWPEADQHLAVRSGVVYTGDGRARLRLATGDYVIFATRGPEYSLAEKKIPLHHQLERVNLELKREVSTDGFAACDTHIHTLTYSGHGDSTAEERALTLAGEGIETAISTEHNIYASYSDAAQRTGVSQYFTNMIGCEVTTSTGHFNVFPVANADAPLPDPTLRDWPALMSSIRATANPRIIVLNHPRDTHNDFVPFDPANFNEVTGDNLRDGSDFTFDAMEVANSGAMRSDWMRTFRDWFALLNHGYKITAVGSSDCHDVSRFIVGQGRSYVKCDDHDPAHLSMDEVCRSFKEGRVAVSLGLLTRLSIDGKFEPGDLATGLGSEMRVRVQVLGPSWIEAQKVELFANGVKIREQAVATPFTAGEKASIEWLIPRPAHDVHLIAIASGPGVTAPYWKFSPPYQPTSRELRLVAIGSTNPVWIDADGDEKFTAARGYAKHLVDRIGTEPGKLLPALATFDEAVAAQVAGLCQSSGADVRSAGFADALKSAPESVKAGFAAYVATIAKK